MKMDYDQGLVLATYIARHLWLWYLSHTDHHTSTFFFWSAAGGYQEPGWRYKRNRLSSMRHMEKITWVSDSSYHLHSASRVPETCTVCDRSCYIWSSKAARYHHCKCRYPSWHHRTVSGHFHGSTNILQSHFLSTYWSIFEQVSLGTVGRTAITLQRMVEWEWNGGGFRRLACEHQSDPPRSWVATRSRRNCGSPKILIFEPWVGHYISQLCSTSFPLFRTKTTRIFKGLTPAASY